MKKTTSLMIDIKYLEEAKERGIVISDVLNDALREVLGAEKEKESPTVRHEVSAPYEGGTVEALELRRNKWVLTVNGSPPVCDDCASAPAFFRKGAASVAFACKTHVDFSRTGWRVFHEVEYA